jgi:hypothetical protein
MSLSSGLRDLDDRVLRDRPSPAREAWGHRHGWSLIAASGCLLVAFGLWALSTGRPAMAGGPAAMGLGVLAMAAYLFVRRAREQSSEPGVGVVQVGVVVEPGRVELGFLVQGAEQVPL